MSVTPGNGEKVTLVKRLSPTVAAKGAPLLRYRCRPVDSRPVARSLLLLLSVLGLLLSADGVGAQRAPARPALQRPNIVVLMTDDQTAQSMQFLPMVRALIGSHGVTFANSFVSYPMCCPSRATYLTGQYAHNHGVLYNTPPTGGYQVFKNQDTTFPVALKRAGYRTIHLGKYLNGYGSGGRRRVGVPPGWSDFRGLVGSWAYNYYGFRMTMNGTVKRFPVNERNYQTDVLTRMAVSVIEREAKIDGPFFLNVGFLAPHSAGTKDETDMGPEPAGIAKGMLSNRLAVPPLRYRGTLKNLPLPRPPSFDEANISDKPSFFRRRSFFRRFNGTDISDITARYHAQLESLLAVDDAVSAIVGALRATHQLADTVVVFTSDNGFFNGEHRIRAGKYYAYEPSIRVPLLIRGPGFPAGVTRIADVANVDLAPTILQLAHAEPLRLMDGLSLVPLLTHPDARWRTDLLLESGPNTVYPAVYTAVRTPRYAYIEYSTGDRELYDLRTDPYELTNRFGDPRLRSMQSSLQRRLAVLRHCRGRTCWDT